MAIIGGDWNARVGHDTVAITIGKYGIEVTLSLFLSNSVNFLLLIHASGIMSGIMRRYLIAWNSSAF